MATSSPACLIRNSGDKAAILGEGSPYSYRQLIRAINGFTRAIVAVAGQTALDPGRTPPRVLLNGDNSSAWIQAYYAILQAGMVVVPVDTQSSASDIQYMIDDCQPVLILGSRAREATIREALATSRPGCSADILILEDLQGHDFSAESDSYDFVPALQTTAVLIYTSGTTGSPKGVMLSYQNLFANLEGVCSIIPIYTFDARILMLLPLHHIFPLLGTMMSSLHVGATIVICPTMSGDAIIRTLGEHKATIILGVPRLYSMIASSIESKINASGLVRGLYRLAGRIHSPGFSRLIFGSVHRRFGGAIRFMISGGAALDPAVARLFQTLGFDLLEGYGMTEAAPMITFTRPGTLRPGSTGQALPCVELAIKDGEIVARGPNIMQGYYQRPEETAAILVDGWLHTGDLGSLDAEGFLFITGRRKEIIVLSNGKNINPAELEDALQASHKALVETAVYQEHDRLHAVVVVDPAHLADHERPDPAAWAREQILKLWNRVHPSYKALAGITVADGELPRTRLGKLRRFQLPAFAASQSGFQSREAGSPVAKPNTVRQSPEFTIIQNYLEREKKTSVQPSDHLVTDLGMDSLDTIGFQAFLESSFGMSLPINELAAFDSVGTLADHLAATKTRTSTEVMDWARILAQKFRNSLPKKWLAAPIVNGVLRFVLHSYFRLTTRGLNNIPDGPCIIVPNHQSFFDGFFIASVLRLKQLQKTFFYAKAKHFKGGFLQRLASLNNVIILDVNNNLKDSILKVAEVLKSQRKLIIFPEGTRTNDGKLGDFKKMFAILAQELKVPIVPLSISGAWEALPRGGHFPLPFKPIRLDFLPAIRAGELSYDALTELVRSTIQGKLGYAGA